MEAATVAPGTLPRARTWDRTRVWTLVGLTVVTAVAMGLRFAAFGRVAGDPFYDAAVRSMGQSWHNFFFGAYEPGGQVAVDKAPADLWLQVASTKLFGFNGVALRLPEAVASVLCVPLLFDVVRRPFGRAAGLCSAAVLAVLPLAVLTGRSDTMDSVMVALLLGSSWFVVRFAQTGRGRFLLAGGAVLGLAFNVKLFEALLVVPALVALALLARTVPWRRLLATGLGATVCFLVVALGWIVAASLAPGRHPWPIGSKNGTIWSTVFGYDGIDRVGVPAPAGAANIDPPGPLRLFGVGGVHYEHFVGSVLVAALVVGGTALVFAAGPLWRDRSPRGRLRRGGVAWIALWLLVGSALFSGMGRLHLRYVEAISPAIAAAVGVGVVTLALAARRRPLAGWLLAAAMVATALLVTGPGQAVSWTRPIALGAAGATVLTALVLTVLRGRARRPAAAILALAALVAALVVPMAATAGVVSSSSSDSGRPGSMPASRLTPLSRYLRAHQDGARYEVAVSNAIRAGALIARDGRPVLLLTTVYGLPIVSVHDVAAAVRGGQLHYLIRGRARCVHDVRRSCPPAIRWALRHGTDVSAQAGQRSGQLFRLGPTVTASGAHIRRSPS